MFSHAPFEFAEGTSLEDCDAYTYEDEYEVALMNDKAKAAALIQREAGGGEAGAVIVDMGDGREQRAFLYADIVTAPGSRQSESLPASRRASCIMMTRPLSKSNIQILRMNSQSDLAQKLAQLIKAEQLHESF